MQTFCTFFLFCEPHAYLIFFDIKIINDLPPSSKFEKCVMRNKESSLLGLIIVVHVTTHIHFVQQL